MLQTCVGMSLLFLSTGRNTHCAYASYKAVAVYKSVINISRKALSQSCLQFKTLFRFAMQRLFSQKQPPFSKCHLLSETSTRSQKRGPRIKIVWRNLYGWNMSVTWGFGAWGSGTQYIKISVHAPQKALNFRYKLKPCVSSSFPLLAAWRLNQ